MTLSGNLLAKAMATAPPKLKPKRFTRAAARPMDDRSSAVCSAKHSRSYLALAPLREQQPGRQQEEQALLGHKSTGGALLKPWPYKSKVTTRKPPCRAKYTAISWKSILEPLSP